MTNNQCAYQENLLDNMKDFNSTNPNLQNERALTQYINTTTFKEVQISTKFPLILTFSQYDDIELQLVYKIFLTIKLYTKYSLLYVNIQNISCYISIYKIFLAIYQYTKYSLLYINLQNIPYYQSMYKIFLAI